MPLLLGMQSKAATAGFTSVKTLTDLRALVVPTGFTMAAAAGHYYAGDSGGGLFYWDAAFLPTQSREVPDDGGTYFLPHGRAASTAGRWRRVVDGPLNPHWFGALGDDSGRTPQDDGLDISAAPWNVWPHWLTSNHADNPAYFGFSIGSATPPFSNTDSWDWIGLQLALLSVGEQYGEVAVGSGTYQLTKPLFYCLGMHATLTGAGMYQTCLTKKPGCFDNSTIMYL